MVNGHVTKILHEIDKFQAKLEAANIPFEIEHYTKCIESRKKFIDSEEIFDLAHSVYDTTIIKMTKSLIYPTTDYKCFTNELNKYLKENPVFKPCNNLNEYNNTPGLYLLVLGKLNRIYIGQAKNIKQRVMRHWSEKQDYPHGIDLFGALDTTAVYVYPLNEQMLDNQEVYKITSFNPDDSLNSSIGAGAPLFIDHETEKEIGRKLSYMLPPNAIRLITELGYEKFISNYRELYTRKHN